MAILVSISAGFWSYPSFGRADAPDETPPPEANTRPESLSTLSVTDEVQLTVQPTVAPSHTYQIRKTNPDVQTSVAMYMFVGLSSAVTTAISHCMRDQNPVSTLGTYIQNLDDHNAPTLPVVMSTIQVSDSASFRRNYSIGLCVFRSDDAGNHWTYVRNLSDVRLSGVDIVNHRGESANISNRDALRRWFAAGTDNYSMKLRDIYNLEGDSRWAFAEQARIEFTRLPDSSGTVPEVIGILMTMRSRTSFAASLELANSYGGSFSGHGKFEALPLTVALGVDLMLAEESDFFLGFRFVASPSIAFDNGSIQDISSIALGGRLDFGHYVGIGAGARISFASDNYLSMNGEDRVGGVVFLTIGLQAMRLLNNQ